MTNGMGVMDDLIAASAAWLALASSAWLVEVIWAARGNGSPSRIGRLTDQIMLIATVGLLMGGWLLRLMVPAAVIHPAWLPISLGIPIGVAGLILRASAMRTLDGGYVLTLYVKPDQELVTWGPYRLVRHPGYAGILLQLLGLELVTGSALAVAAVSAVLALTLIRIRVEESMLSECWGGRYEAYRKSTPFRVLPGVY
jgi:protein-S-isoprenylcysteine O-methyltransferase Ste14